MTTPPKPPPPTNRPPPPTIGSSQRPPANLKDALAEARAISGGAGLSRPSTAPGSFSPANSVRGKKTVMIVDDDASMRTRLRAGLEVFYDIIECKDGMEAAEMAGSIQPPAMIVCDVVMPRVDGFTLAKILRGNPIMKKVPIMFVSSRNSPQDVRQALTLGACQYVLKTTPIGEIVAKIRKIVV
jgi:CheY-like chemotaxis protein